MKKIKDIYAKLKEINRRRNLKTKEIKNIIKLKKISIFYRKRTSLQSIKGRNVCIFMHTQAIGDAIVTSGLIYSLRDNGFIVTVICNNRTSIFFKHMIEVDSIIEIDSNDHKKHISEIRNKKIDLVIDTSDIDASFLLRARDLSIIKPSHSIGFNQPTKSMYDTAIKTKEPEHISKRMNYICQVLSIENKRNNIIIQERKMKEAVEFIRKISLQNEKLIILNPFASQKTRDMPNDKIQLLIEALDALNGYKTIIFTLGRDINIDRKKNIVINPFNDIETSFALVRHSHVVITVDTAIVHLSSSMNKKQFCIYNNRLFNGTHDNNIIWGPNSEHATIITTTQNKKVECGDDMSSIDMERLIDLVKSELTILT